MPLFAYTAVDQLGRPARGRLEAGNDIDLELHLKRMGLDLVGFRTARQRPRFDRKRVSLRDLILFCFQMEQLMHAGVPVLQSLTDLRDGASNPALRAIIGQVATAVEGGELLSQALARHPAAFGPVFVSLVRAGEQSGKLAEIFDHLASTLQWQEALLAQTRRLLVYPLFVLLTVLAATVFLMVYLVPQMAGFLQNMGQTLPLQTRILIALSAATLRWGWLVVALAVVFMGVALAALRHSPTLRQRFDHLKLQLPVTGAILQKIILALFTRYFALLYQAGIPVLDALGICRGIAGNHVVADGLEHARQQISAGASMSESFRDLGLFPPLVVRMIRVGENTGALDRALLNASQFYERDVRDALETLLKLLEPALTVVLGALLAMIMFSVLGPVYASFTQLKF